MSRKLFCWLLTVNKLCLQWTGLPHSEVYPWRAAWRHWYAIGLTPEEAVTQALSEAAENQPDTAA